MGQRKLREDDFLTFLSLLAKVVVKGLFEELQVLATTSFLVSTLHFAQRIQIPGKIVRALRNPPARAFEFSYFLESLRSSPQISKTYTFKSRNDIPVRFLPRMPPR